MDNQGDGNKNKITGFIKDRLKQAGKKRLFMAAAVLLALCALATAFAITWYGTFPPNASRVISASLYMNTEDLFEYENYEGGNSYSAAKSMELTDINALNDVVSAGFKSQGNSSSGWPGTAHYRLKSGKTISRNICIPFSLDENLMDLITGSPAYKNGLYPAWDEGLISWFINGGGHIYYSDGLNGHEIDIGLLRELLSSFQLDKENYCFSTAKNEEALFIIDLSMYSDEGYLYGQYTVYPSYENTINLLSDNGIYQGPLSAGDFSYIKVSRYDEETGGYEASGYENSDDIKRIFDCCINRISSVWKNYDDIDDRFIIEAVLKESGLTYCGLQLKEGSAGLLP